MWLRRHRVLLPGGLVLARQVSEARTTTERCLYQPVARGPRTVSAKSSHRR
ncbi:hypothetical protein [Streptomyces sp. YKOK-I1]